VLVLHLLCIVYVRLSMNCESAICRTLPPWHKISVSQHVQVGAVLCDVTGLDCCQQVPLTFKFLKIFPKVAIICYCLSPTCRIFTIMCQKQNMFMVHAVLFRVHAVLFSMKNVSCLMLPEVCVQCPIWLYSVIT